MILNFGATAADFYYLPTLLSWQKSGYRKKIKSVAAGNNMNKQSKKELFIAAKKIKNEGLIGSDDKAVIITEGYEGHGQIYTGKNNLPKEKKWYKDARVIVPAVIGLLGILITIILTL